MSNRVKTGILAIIAAGFIAIFLFTDAGGDWGYVLPRRSIQIIAIVLTGGAIAISTVVFMTITNNRILTPSIIGLDSLYMLIQTFVIFVFGSTTLTTMNKNVHFILSAGLMVLFAGVLYKVLFKKEQQNIYFLLLIGLILGTLFESLSSFLQILLAPGEFLVLQDKMFASLNNVNTDILLVAMIALICTFAYFARFAKYLDVLSLGREQAVNLGVDYDYVVKRLLIIIAIFVSVATALVGPITFLGLLVANVAHEFFKTYRHQYLIPGAVLISVIALVGGHWMVDKVFAFSTPLSVIVNFVGGVYFIYLLLKENKSWSM